MIARSRFVFSSNTWWKIIIVIFFFIVIIDAMRPALGYIEGRISPVVANVQILNIEEDARVGNILFSGTYEKLRDCQIVGYEWFLTSPDGFRRERFDVYIVNSLWREEGMGERQFGPRMAFINPLELIDYSLGVAIHDCHPVFDTRSLFYKGTMVR